MRKQILTAVVLAVVLVLVLAAPVGAKKPLNGEMALDWLGAPCEDTFYTWNGTVTFGEDSYAMAFFNLGTGKPFPEDPNEHVGFFGEIWAIYDDGFPAGGDGCEILTDDVVMWGTDTGIGTSSNFKYRMNGEVEFAIGDFDGWQGRNVHMSGEFFLDPDGAPLTAPGTFRAN